MLTLFMAIIVAAAAGLGGVLPISSLGHALFAAEAFTWHGVTAQAGADFSPFLTLIGMIQLVTGLLLIIWHRQYWMTLWRGLAQAFKSRHVTTDNLNGQLGILLLISISVTIGVSFVLDHALRTAFAKPFFGIIFIIIQGILYIKGDVVVRQIALSRSRNRDLKIAAPLENKTLQHLHDHLSPRRAVELGLLQSLALLPGFSRIGMSMLMSLRYGLNHANAAQLSFLIAGPALSLIGAWRLSSMTHSEIQTVLPELLIGAVVGLIVAIVALQWFLRYIQRGSLRPFGWYCVGIGVFMLLLALFRGSVQ